jgi:hypothetical protein
MSWLDILVSSGVVAAVAYPFIASSLRKLALFKTTAATQEEWRQRWTATLIDLLADLDRDGMKQGATLCRELMWEIIGGEGGSSKK